MNIENFQEYVPKDILKRGKEYFDNQFVDDLEEYDDGGWSAVVLGSDVYFVEISISGSSITKCECDCPHDNSICKHIVAVLFSISEMKNIQLKKHNKTNKAQKLTIKRLLEKINEGELREFITHYSKANKNFKADFEFYFSSKDDNYDVAQMVESQIKSIIKKYSKWNYIDYSSSNALARELSKFLQSGEQYLKNNNLLDASKFTMTFIKEVTPALEYTDDSSGSVADVIISSIDLLLEIISKAPFSLKERITDLLKVEVQKSMYYEFGECGHTLINIYSTLCSELNRSSDFIDFAEKRIYATRVNGDVYEHEFFVVELILFLFEENNQEYAMQLIYEYLHLPAVRQILVEELISMQEFDSAITLIEDGISLANEHHSFGLVKQWERNLLRIAEIQGDNKTLRKNYEKLAFDPTFSSADYQKWKNTYSAEEWPSIIENKIKSIRNKIQKAKKANKWQSEDYLLLISLGPIFVQEKMYKELIELIKKQTELNIILQYHSYLKDLYPEDLMKLYLPLLEQLAEFASDRSAYKNLLRVVNLIYNDIPSGRNALNNQCIEWKVIYQRRPAMQDEINKFIERVS